MPRTRSDDSRLRGAPWHAESGGDGRVTGWMEGRRPRGTGWFPAALAALIQLPGVVIAVHDVQTAPCFVQNEQVHARAGISAGSGTQSSKKEKLPQ